MAKKVAIIGAGPAGLIVAAGLLEAGLDVSVFEQRECLGGTWAIQKLSSIPDVREGLAGIHSAAYPSLRTNFPIQLMELPGQPWPEDSFTYPSHEMILERLKLFASTNALLPHIHFNTTFTGLKPAHNKVARQWLVELNGNTQALFDAVVFCTGRYDTPALPTIPGMDSFDGKIEHSLSYRGPCAYEGKRVAVLGTGPSGEDISREIATTAERVFLCAHKGSRVHLLPEKGHYGVRKNITRHCNISGMAGHDLYLENGNCLEAIDCLLLCTGYRINDKILSALPGCSPSGSSCEIPPLYLNLFHPEYPELSVTAIDVGSFPFLLYHYQARVIARYLTKKIEFPNTEQRIFAAQRAKLQQQGRVSFEVRRQMATQQFSILARLANMNDSGKEVNELAKLSASHRKKYPETYRDTPWD